MNLEQIKLDWKKDSVIDEIMLDESSMRIPQIHYKYVTYHTEFSILLKKKQQEFKKLCHSKFLYYSGKADPEVYAAAPFQHKVLKSDVKNWIDVDADVQKNGTGTRVLPLSDLPAGGNHQAGTPDVV